MQSLLSLLFLFTTTQTLLQQQQNADNLWYFDYVDIVYREERGANETWRFEDHPMYEIQAQKRAIQPKNSRRQRQSWLYDQRVTYLQEVHPNEYDIHRTITHIGDQKLYREQEYFYPKNKIIIHHSAMPTRYINTQAGITKHVKEIQELHTFYRDRGDIGYHFLIDKFGTIYEGKAGGPGIVGAHAQFNNFNSIGINLLGNFQEEYPSLEQIKSLIKLLISLTDYYHLDLDQEALFHAKSETEPYIEDFYDDPISYHKKVGLTACPGTHLLSKIPFIEDFLKVFPLTFSQRQNHALLIDDIFKELALSANQQEIEDYLLYFQREGQNNTKIKQDIPETRTKNTIIIYQKTTTLIVPENKEIQDKLLTKYTAFLSQIAQDTSISTTQREYFISIFNKFIYHEQLFLNNKNNNNLKQNRDLFYLYTRKLLLSLKSLAN